MLVNNNFLDYFLTTLLSFFADLCYVIYFFQLYKYFYDFFFHLSHFLLRRIHVRKTLTSTAR